MFARSPSPGPRMPYAMRRHTATAALRALLPPPAAAAAQPRAAERFTFAQVRSYPYPTELTAAATGSRIAWAFEERGRRNVWVAEGPAFAPRQLTRYDRDDGQELTSVSVSADGRWVVYARGGDHGSNWDDAAPVNPTQSPVSPKVQVWAAPCEGGAARARGDGDNPVVSPRGDVVAFEKDGQIWTSPVDGSAPAKRLF